MNDISAKLSALSALAQRSQTLMPEMGSTLTLLGKDLASILRLDLPRDRRLMTVDLDNLIDGMERASRLRGEGFDPQELEAAIIDMTALAADMRARAAKAIRNEAGQIAIHASVAAMNADRSGEPQDLTREFKMVAAAPAPKASDAPGVLVRVPEGDAQGTYGRIVGKVLAYLHSETRASARAGSVYLPAGSVARFEKGDAVILQTQGVGVYGDRFKAPTASDEVLSTIVEALEGGMSVYGPAIISPYTGSANDLSSFVTLTNAHGEYKGPPPGDSNFIVGALLSIGGLLACMPAFHQGFQTMGSLITFGLIAGCISMIAGFITMARGNYLNKKDQDQSESSPEAAAIAKLNLRITGALGEERSRSIYPEMTQGDGLNFYPARMVQALTHDDMLVMRPLPALPAPNPLHDLNITPLRQKTA